MSMKVKVKKKLTSRSQRVKCVEFHLTEPWMLTSLYDGNAYIWNTDTKKVLKSLTVSDLPVRAAKFVFRKNWFITASDDAVIRVINYNTGEKVTQFSAHRDYIRSLAVHATRPFLLSCSDDGSIKLWDWERKWACVQHFRGHIHLVMQVTFNPKDNNQFASASMDKSVKIWQLGATQPNFSLRHERGVNCLSYHPGGDKPYIVSGLDGGTIKVWDYQNKSCVQTLHGHAKDVYAVEFHPSMPLIISGASDGTVRMWHSSTFRMVTTLNFDMGRVWTLAVLKSSNDVAIGFDDGSMIIKLGREEPAFSMDSSGKIVWARQSELQQANVKALQGQKVKDGEKLSLVVKDVGSCEVYPQTISHSPNGRFVSVSGDGEYTIYTGVALRNKAYGSAQEFVWSSDSSMYATRDRNSLITVFRNFKSYKSFKPPIGADGIFGGHLLGVRYPACLTFHDWESNDLVRRIEITPTQIYWSETADLLSIVSEDSFYILRYDSEAVERARDQGETTTVTEDGVEDAFEVVTEFDDKVCTGLWVGDCFIYTNSINRLKYCIGEETVTISQLDRTMYLLGYIPKENRLYLIDKELIVVSFSLLVSVLEYQTAVMRRDFDTADKVLPAVPREHRTRVAHFLEKQGFRSQALSVSLDLDHKFDLAIQLEDLNTAVALARQLGSADKWKQVSDMALRKAELGLAQECLYASQDFAGLLLVATSIGDRNMLSRVAQAAAVAGQTNVAFNANFLLGRYHKCMKIMLETNRFPEAAMFARSYIPSQVPRIVSLWRDSLSATHSRLGAAIASPVHTENLFPDMRDALKTEQFLSQQTTKNVTPASQYRFLQDSRQNAQRHPVGEMLLSEASGMFVYNPESPVVADGSDDEEAEADGLRKPRLGIQVRSKYATPLTPSQNTPLVPLPGNTSASDVGIVKTKPEVVEKVSDKPEGLGADAIHPQTNPHIKPEAASVVKASTSAPPGAADEEFEGISNDELILSLEEELARDLEGVDLDDFDMDEFDLDSDGLLED